MYSPEWKITYNVKHGQNKSWIAVNNLFPYMRITWSSDSLSLYYIWLMPDTETNNVNLSLAIANV